METKGERNLKLARQKLDDAIKIDEEREKEILEVLKRNPEVLQGIVKKAQQNGGHCRELNDYVLGRIMTEFDLSSCPQSHRIRECMSYLMRFAIGAIRAKDINTENYTLARNFYIDLLDLIKKYKRKGR